MSDEVHSLQTYVSDMLALEQHVRVPFETQSKDEDFSDYSQAGSLTQKLLELSQSHIEALNQALSELGGHEASGVKNVVSGFEGFIAGTIDKMRKTKVSKALRDDYTALALCTAGYTMLQTTALALENDQVARLSEKHLRDYAACIMSIGRALPAIVLQELDATGLLVNQSMAEPAQRAAEQAWRSGAGAATSDRGTVEGSVGREQSTVSPE